MANHFLRAMALTLSVGTGFFTAGTQDCFGQGVPGNYHRNYGYVTPYTGYGGWGGYGGYGGWGGGMTAAMGEGIGIGAAARGLGQEAKDIGAARIEQQQANLTYLQAFQEYLKTVGLEHDDIQKLIKEHDSEVQAKVAAARKDVETYKHDMANKAAPHRLTPEQFDRSSSVIYWPMVLRKPVFDEYRYQLDQLFHQRTAQNSGVASDNDASIQKACDDFLKAVGKDINNLNIDQYITARHFITSLQYEGRFAVK